MGLTRKFFPRRSSRAIAFWRFLSSRTLREEGAFFNERPASPLGALLTGEPEVVSEVKIGTVYRAGMA
jgi:hypothetical protein